MNRDETAFLVHRQREQKVRIGDFFRADPVHRAGIFSASPQFVFT